MTDRRPRLNKQWHQKNRMPAKATMEQRVQWHLEHAKYCACREIPEKVAEAIRKMGISEQ
jgi:hypothetical protein